MKGRGLCSTCVHDKDCTFPRRFPVLLCEEFSSETMSSVHREKTVSGGKGEENHVTKADSTSEEEDNEGIFN